MAKVERMRSLQESESLLVCGALRLKLLQQRVAIQDGTSETHLDLKPIEFKLLLHFMQNPELVLSREQLLNAVWGNTTFIVDRTVDRHICSLRKKLLSCAHYLETVPSFGYKFTVPTANSAAG
jgi:DNA-binding response OmpR family regulator